MHQRRRGINLFTHNGGVAIGLKEEIQFLLFTSFNALLRGDLMRKMDSGELPRAPIIKFAYTITADLIPSGVDIVVGLIHHSSWQEKELTVPDSLGCFPSPILPQDRIHRASLYESLFVAKACKATEILLFFPYNPFLPALKTMEVVKNQHVSMRCFEFALQGRYIPTKYLYALQIKRLGAWVPKSDTVEIIQVNSLSIKVTNTKKTDGCLTAPLPPITNDEFFCQKSAFIWDIAPGIIQEAMRKMKVIQWGEEHLLKIYTSLEKSEGEPWIFSSTKGSNDILLDFVSQGPTLGTLGWGV